MRSLQDWGRMNFGLNGGKETWEEIQEPHISQKK
jgi:hypothetical protein